MSCLFEHAFQTVTERRVVYVIKSVCILLPIREIELKTGKTGLQEKLHVSSMKMTVSGSRAPGDASLDVTNVCDPSQNSAHSDCQFRDVFSQNYSPSSLTTDSVTDEVHDEGD